MFKQKSVYIHIRKGVVPVFQNNLKALRMKKGLSQGELAIRLNVVRQTVSKWEKAFRYLTQRL